MTLRGSGLPRRFQVSLMALARRVLSTVSMTNRLGTSGDKVNKLEGITGIYNCMSWGINEHIN